MTVTTSALVSVVVNNHNYGRFLPRAIDSALAQTYGLLEVIVVDDGSTDNSREIISSYGDRIVPVLKENGGQASALNAGFAASRGEVIVFLDADDVLLPTALERAVEGFTGPGVTKVQWQLLEIDESGRETGRLQPLLPLSEGDLREKIIREGPWGGNSAPTSGNAWSKEFLERVLPMPEAEFRINSDGYLVTLAWIYGEVRNLRAPVSLYRVHGQNNFASMPTAAKRTRLLEKYLHRCAILSEHLGRMGIEVDAEVWQANNDLCQWDRRLKAAREQLSGALPSGARIILVDEDGWGYDSATREVVPGVFAFPYIECDGQYGGHPEDSRAAVEEVERLRRAGAQFMVFTWATVWLLTEFPELKQHLDDRYSCRMSNELLVIFDLSQSAKPSIPALS